MLGGILLIAMVVAALLVMLGLTDLAKGIAVVVMLIAVVVPCLAPLLIGVARQIDTRGLVLIVVVVLVAIFVAGYKRHLDHRRELHHWWSDGPTSLKHRVEEDV